MITDACLINTNWSTAEVSDGSITIEHDVKCRYISKLAKAGYRDIWSGFKGCAKDFFAPYKWIKLMNARNWSRLMEGNSRSRRKHSITLAFTMTQEEMSLEFSRQESLTRYQRHHYLGRPAKQQVWFIKLIGYSMKPGQCAPIGIIPRNFYAWVSGRYFFDHFKIYSVTLS